MYSYPVPHCKSTHSSPVCFSERRMYMCIWVRCSSRLKISCLTTAVCSFHSQTVFLRGSSPFFLLSWHPLCFLCVCKMLSFSCLDAHGKHSCLSCKCKAFPPETHTYRTCFILSQIWLVCSQWPSCFAQCVFKKVLCITNTDEFLCEISSACMLWNMSRAVKKMLFRMLFTIMRGTQ